MSLSIIGSGFIGGYVSKILNEQNINHSLYNSQVLNLCDERTWKNISPRTTQVLITAGSMLNDVAVLKKINEDPIKRLCNYFQSNSVSKIIFLSSGAVYGDYSGRTHPDMSCNPTSAYGQSKLNAEFHFLENWKGLLNIIRLYFTYGPHQNKPRLVPNLIDKIQNNKFILINEDGGPELTLNHVDDTARNLIKIFILHNHMNTFENLASPFTVKIKDLAIKLAAYLGKKPLFQINCTKQSNVMSTPSSGNWPKSGCLKDLFHAS